VKRKGKAPNGKVRITGEGYSVFSADAKGLHGDF
jgi:hypothetical protein